MEFQSILRDFAVNVMQPTGVKLDKTPTEQVIAEDSSLWEFRKQYLELGISLDTLGRFSIGDPSPFLPLFFEELRYGDAGLAISIGAGLLPQYLSAKFKNHFLMERFPETMWGCWAINDPEHNFPQKNALWYFQQLNINFSRPNCMARQDNKKIIINCQKSAWVSNSCIAEVCILFCLADLAEGQSDPKQGYVVLVPMDSLGVTRGKPIEKLGLRALNQAELFFDDVELSMDYVLAGPDTYHRAVYCIQIEVNSLMGSIFTGVAQSAYDIALDYAHEFKQGEQSIILHQSVAQSLFHMYRKVEMVRALTRRTYFYNNSVDVPALLLRCRVK
jgi:hypothetical protein